MAELRDLVMDAFHALRLARFWEAVLDTHRLPELTDELRAWLVEHGIDVDNPPSIGLDPISPPGPRIWFNNVPDPTPGKNRLHLDVNLSSDEELQRLLDLGATVVSRPEDHGERWWVLADVEGNVFCAFPPEEPPAPPDQ